MKNLCVFDIQRTAYHDGPGIRTTVFVKGCPLNCVWCHNPESKKFEPQLACIFNKCTSCGTCVKVCKNSVHSIENGEHKINFSKCTLCEACVRACLPHAMKIYGQAVTSRELIETARKDEAFYRASGGGLTVSGGEPMAQFEGTLELLREAKAAGLHTCLDTSGFAPAKNFEAIMPYVDIFLFYYKMSDPAKHWKYTGVSNELIFSNLAFLNRSGKELFLRCPIIPGLNDNDEHLCEITRLSNTYRYISQVNIMAYHEMAAGKVRQIGESYPLAHIKTMERSEKQKIYERLIAMGCTKLSES